MLEFGYVSSERASNSVIMTFVRQLFVVKEERQKGYCAELVKHFIREECGKPDENGNLFLMESPKPIVFKLLQKLGYAEENEKGLRLVNCSWIQSPI